MTAFITYAQNFEDVLLWRVLRQVEGGAYVDVGANDPVADSVSKAFYDRGWRGVHVEPVPEYAERLRRARPDEQVIQAALGEESGLLTFFVIPDTGMSTAVPQFAETCRRQGYAVIQTTVPCLRLDDVLTLVVAPEIHWLKIDVEGFEREVLAGWSGRRRPWILVVEATPPQSQVEAHQAWEPLILEKGYVHVFADGLNRYYLASEHLSLREAFRYGANVFDGFEAAETCWISRTVVRERDRRLAEQMAEQTAEQTAALEALHNALADAEARAGALSAEIMRVRQGESARLRETLERERNLTDRLYSLQAAAAAERQSLQEERRQFVGQVQILSEQMTALRRHMRNPIWLIRHWLTGSETAVLPAGAAPSPAQDPQNTPSESKTSGSVAELLALDDAAFLDAAYRVLLRRPGDFEGLTFYRMQLNRGRGREEILAQIRLSQEGRKVGATLDGLPPVLRGYRYRKLPVFGPLLRLADRIRTPCRLPPPTFSVADLLSHHDETFLVTAYQTLLHRYPDSAGRSYYLKRLRDGVDRREILAQLCFSPEGRRVKAQVAGLAAMMRRYRWQSVPVIGTLLGHMGIGEPRGGPFRRYRMIENLTSRILDDFERRFQENERRLEAISVRILAAKARIERL